MSEEDSKLSQSLHKLKIIPKPKQPKLYNDDELPLKLNPFLRRSRSKSFSTTSLFGPTCVCRRNRVCKNTTKKMANHKKNKLLREPVIVLHEKCKHELSNATKLKLSKSKTDVESETSKSKSELFGDGVGHQDFRSIIAGCEQLSLSNDVELQTFPTQNFRDTQASTSAVSRTENRELSSCSQQAMARLCLNPPCDVTIDELASYFETLVHIPKKMSSMAEMMYI